MNCSCKYDPEMKPAVVKFGTAKIRKPSVSRALVKIVLVLWFFVLNHKDIVYVECLVQVQTRGSGSVLNCGKHLESYRNTAILGRSIYWAFWDLLCLVCSVITV